MAAANEPINDNNGGADMVIQISQSVKAKPSVFATKTEEQNPLIANSKQEQQQNQRQRLVSLDVFRGITVALMILVDDAGGLLPAINHSPWNGLTLADFVMPFFLFIAGVSLALTYKKLTNRAVATKKAILRTLKLLVFGILLQGGYIDLELFDSFIVNHIS
ncbi:hypothetical protein LWI28_028417 [Acer negundo]|uniref:Heparan-alpha-glucosaminide N-acetyltransferase catalytic domain-containing protein n=1 Tax=Acer negundo TaxID=4023 RepID=A0AAD5IB50_ACENE|nr:hypothetical protein LWI28_028417 [Acer negundo]